MKSLTLFVATLALALSATAQDYRTVEVHKESIVRPDCCQMNNSGQVTGSTFDSNVHLFRWSKTTKFQDLGTLGGSTSFNSAINDAGQIAGQADLSGDTATDAILWSPATGMQDLGNLGGYLAGAVALNNSGQVVGYSYTPGNHTTHAFFWAPSGGMQDIGAGDGSGANAINASGQVLGSQQDNQGHSYPFLWSQTSGLQYLTPPGSTGSTLTGINDSGLVIGNANRSDCAIDSGCGFTWTQAGGFQTLAMNGASVSALYVNASGAVVGFAGSNYSNQHAFLWTQSGGIQDLGVLPGKTSSFPYALNNKGEVLGVSCISDGTHCKSFVWRPGQGMKAILHSNSYKIFTQLNDAGQILGLFNYSQTVLLSPWVHVKLVSSQNPSKMGQSVTFTARANSVEGAPKDGELVTFKTGKTVLGTAPLVAGVASLTTSSLVVGTHAVTATYAGDVNYDSETSGALQQVVTP